MTLNTFSGDTRDSAGNTVGGIQLTVWTTQARTTQVMTLYDSDGVTLLPGYVTSSSAAAPSRGRWVFKADSSYSVLWLWDGNAANDPWPVVAVEASTSIGEALAKSNQAITDSANAVNTANAAESTATTADNRSTDAMSQSTEALDKANQAIAQTTEGLGIYNVVGYGAVGDGVTDDTSAVLDTIAAAPAGSTVLFPAGTYKITSTLSVGKPLKIDGPGATVKLASATSTTLFEITSSDVKVTGVTLEGPGLSGNDYVADNLGINVLGTSGAQIEGLSIDGVTMSGWLDSAAWVEWAKDPSIVNNRITDCIYAGIMLLSPKGGVVSGNIVDNITQGTGGLVVNSYGIAVTDITNDAAGRAEDLTISNNVVRNVPNWEGIDTHGGKNITVTGNLVIGCKSSIAMVSGNPSRVYAPENVVVSGNVVDATGGSSPTQGIGLVGVSGGMKASGTIVGNTIIGTFSLGRVYVNYLDRAKTQCDDWIAYAPTWSGVTVGNAVQNCRYSRVGNTVTAKISLVLGSTSSVTSLIDFTLPVPPKADYEPYTSLGDAVLSDVSGGGTGHYDCSCFLLTLGSGGRAYFLWQKNQVTQSFFAWASGDKITATITYECEPG